MCLLAFSKCFVCLFVLAFNSEKVCQAIRGRKICAIIKPNQSSSSSSSSSSYFSFCTRSHCLFYNSCFF
jgi:hypothetical protein